MPDHNVTGQPHSITPAPAAPLPENQVAPAPAPTTSVPQARSRAKPAMPEPKDSLREVVETIVFVVVLVLLLKTFAAEAFVIPTGSMATTLWGYQKLVTCPQCGYEFPVNCSSEVEDQPHLPVRACTCPNCFYAINFANDGLRPACNTGDRVLVAKSLYDSHLMDLKPLDVVVFKFPEEPQVKFTPMNYIKRLIGLPGQTIGIYYGDIYVAPEDADPGDTEEEKAEADRGSPVPLRRKMHRDKAKVELEEGKPRFQILRKSPDKVVAMMRIVNDHDHPAADLLHNHFPLRWAPEQDAPAGENNVDFAVKRSRAAAAGIWAEDAPHHGFRHARRQGEGDVAWLRYRHLVRPIERPQLITDFMGYNSARPESQLNWVGDLVLECDVTVDQAEANDELWLELSKGADRFQARFRLDSGACTLVRIKRGKDGAREEEVLNDKPASTRLKKPGTYHLRFANVDQRLTLWVDKDLPFAEGQAYDPPRDKNGRPDLGPVAENDLEPVSIGVRAGSVGVSHLKVWRDTYYTYQRPRWMTPPEGRQQPPESIPEDVWSDPSRWNDFKLNELPALTLYVQQGHYLCLGDNSPQSSDSRSWGKRTQAMDDRGGLVPESLLLGRALMVYYPFYPLGNNRAGPIR